MRQPCHRHDWRLRCIRARLPEDAGRRSRDFEGRGSQKICHQNSRPHSPRSKPEPKDAWKQECAPVLVRGLADTLAGLIHKQIEASLFTRWFVISKFRYPTIPPTFFDKKFSIKGVRGATPLTYKNPPSSFLWLFFFVFEEICCSISFFFKRWARAASVSCANWRSWKISTSAPPLASAGVRTSQTKRNSWTAVGKQNVCVFFKWPSQCSTAQRKSLKSQWTSQRSQ